MLPNADEKLLKLVLCFPLQSMACTGHNVLSTRDGTKYWTPHRLYFGSDDPDKLDAAELQLQYNRLHADRVELKRTISSGKGSTIPLTDRIRETQECITKLEHKITNAGFQKLYERCCGQFIQRFEPLEQAIEQIQAGVRNFRAHQAIRAFCYGGLVRNSDERDPHLSKSILM